MDKKEIEKYKIRDYYMIPVEVVDNMFYLFEQQCKKQKEVIDKAIKELFILKEEIYKPETREENFEIQNKISSIIIMLNKGSDSNE